MKISIVLPTRGRPDNLRRLLTSLHETSEVMPEVIVYVDDDDPTLEEVKKIEELVVVVGPRQMLSKCWNDCLPAVTGDILMMGGDDLIFRTKGWDRMVVKGFESFPDRLIFVHGDDGSWNGKAFGTHGFIHRNWVDKVGYFAPPYFASDYSDTWLNDISNKLNRRVYLQFVTEHMHPAWGKAEWDQTHKERIARHEAQCPGWIYEQTREQRGTDTEKLRKAMNSK